MEYNKQQGIKRKTFIYNINQLFGRIFTLAKKIQFILPDMKIKPINYFFTLFPITKSKRKYLFKFSINSQLSNDLIDSKCQILNLGKRNFKDNAEAIKELYLKLKEYEKDYQCNFENIVSEFENELRDPMCDDVPEFKKNIIRL